MPGVVSRRPEGSRVSELQRARLVAAAVGVIAERGYARTTVAQITVRARVSRRTFYDLFANREECLAAVLDDVARMVEDELARAGLEGLAWRERIREGLLTILTFLDREPALARVCVVEALRADQALLGRRGELLERLTAVVDAGRREGARGVQCSPLTAEGVVGAAFAIVHARLVQGDSGPLADLAGELAGMIVLPYLGLAAARRERGRQLSTQVRAVRGARTVTPASARDPFEGLPLRLTYRTARVLEVIAQLESSAADPSNRVVADHAGIHDAGQISKLLRRLERLGLLVNTGAGHAKGEPNAWALTPRGQRVAQSIRVHNRHESEAA